MSMYVTTTTKSGIIIHDRIRSTEKCQLVDSENVWEISSFTEYGVINILLLVLSVTPSGNVAEGGDLSGENCMNDEHNILE